MKINDIVAISGKGTLYKMIQPTHTGMIFESMDEYKKRRVVTMYDKVSSLSKISVYTTGTEDAVPLERVMCKIHKEFSGNTDLDRNSSPEELKSFLKFILPEYDENRVYVSDIKKIVHWYDQLVKQAPEVLEDKTEGERKKS